MCDSSISNPSIVANLRPRLCRCANVCQWPILDGIRLLQALLGFAVTASCHSRSVSVRSADRSMQHCLGCAIPRD
jgi:hypothetical protein